MTGRLEACIRLAERVGVKGKKILDVGCSYPWFLEYALEKGAKSVMGIEPNLKKVRAGRKQVPKAIIKQGYANKLNFSDKSFELVTLLDVIEHIPKNTELVVLSEINRVLKPKGYLIVSTPLQNLLSNISDPAWYFGHRHYSEERLKKLLNNSGFKVTHTETHGSIWEIVAVWVLYFTKWVLRIKMPFEEWFDVKRRKEYREPGFVALMVIAKKV